MLLCITTNKGTKYYKCEEFALGENETIKILREFGTDARLLEKSYAMEIEVIPNT